MLSILHTCACLPLNLPLSLIFPITSPSHSQLLYKTKQRLRKEEEKSHQNKITKMALQATQSLPTAPPLLSSPTTGLRRPSDRFALKSSFFSPSVNLLFPQQAPASAAPKFSMRVASKQAYICRDCGYIYNDRTPFEKVPDSYFCPVCGAPKRRFRAYAPDVSKNANATDVRKARKAELQRDEAIGKALPIAIVVGVAALAGLYFYLNSTY